MIPKNINIEKFAKEYWKNNVYPEGPNLFWDARIESILYTLADEEENYDEPYIYNIVNIMISAYQKFVPKVLADNILNMENLFYEIEVESEIWDVAFETMKQDIPEQEKIDKIFSSLENTYNEMVENKQKIEYEAEMYRLQHPILTAVKKMIIPFILLCVVLWITMTILVATGKMEIPEKLPVISAFTVFGTIVAFFLFVIIGGIISTIRSSKQ